MMQQEREESKIKKGDTKMAYVNEKIPKIEIIL